MKYFSKEEKEFYLLYPDGGFLITMLKKNFVRLKV